ncbi:antitoxin [Sphingomonas lenta]|nr:AbrB/MazE/SpoVT family DNA-binding domain-containing protein [Sphingomonas lenta]
MGVHETKTFKSGNSEAVRLPKEFAFGPGTPVRLERDGDAVVIRPVPVEDPEEARRTLKRLIADLNAIGRPGVVQKREPIEFPNRPGLS